MLRRQIDADSDAIGLGLGVLRSGGLGRGRTLLGPDLIVHFHRGRA